MQLTGFDGGRALFNFETCLTVFRAFMGKSFLAASRLGCKRVVLLRLPSPLLGRHTPSHGFGKRQGKKAQQRFTRNKASKTVSSKMHQTPFKVSSQRKTKLEWIRSGLPCLDWLEWLQASGSPTRLIFFSHLKDENDNGEFDGQVTLMKDIGTICRATTYGKNAQHCNH